MKDQMCRNNFDWLDRSSPPSPPTSHADTSTFSEDADMSEISIPQSPPLPPRPKPKKGVCLGIVNCKVEFPFPPYSSQVSMMSRVTRVEEFNRAVEQMIVLGGGRDTVIYDGGDSTRDETQINLSRLPSMSQAGGFVPDSAKAPLNCGATAASTGEPCHDLKPTDQTIELNHSLANVTNSTLPLLKPGQTPRMQRVPRIYYGTRTHKQITQIVKELDRTEYRTVKMTILASREHSCIHPQLVGQPGKNEKCKDLLAQDSLSSGVFAVTVVLGVLVLDDMVLSLSPDSTVSAPEEGKVGKRSRPLPPVRSDSGGSAERTPLRRSAPRPSIPPPPLRRERTKAQVKLGVGTPGAESEVLECTVGVRKKRTHGMPTAIITSFLRRQDVERRQLRFVLRHHQSLHKTDQLLFLMGGGRGAQGNGVGCKFYTQKDRLRRAYLPFDGAWDLEDIVNLGDRRAACPYFGTRDLREDAEIVFCPYNYLIDPIIRKSMEIDLRGQVIILDEAHNLEDNARDAVSAIFLSNEIAMLRDDLDRMSKGNLEPVGHDLLARYFTALLQWMEGASVSRESFSGSFDKTANTVTGHCWLQEVETRAQITRQAHAEAKVTYGRCVEAARAADEALAEVQGSRGAPWQRRSKKRGGARTGGTGMVAADGGARLHPLALGLLEKWFLVLDLMVAGGRPVEEDYAVAVTERELNRNELNKIYNSWGGHPANPTGNRTRKLYLWCLNPGLAFFPIVKSARDVILTSGTLTPMDTFSSELGVEFNQQLSAKHVIGQDQVFVDCVSRGPSRNLLLTYQQQSKPEVLVELAELVFDVSLRTPKGILVFFPSYGMMNSTMSYWGETLRSESGLTYMEEIFSVKKVLSEPRDGSQLVDTMDEYRAIIRSSPVLTFEQQTQKRQVTGAILMAVFRGKISEGIDFADDDARAVITVRDRQ
ncbi:unnamed protein product [Cyprideis torosa]|uniref:Uncharacterized protein n=1 Tax=Cyprideis torosa TaxID=163714 RepID=A0A7R8ZI03_9CRUS|nr:unnamed protein product [Cyprideis torosa]CAG0883683.1 unnamed protein product [Cyprideis torosa]